MVKSIFHDFLRCDSTRCTMLEYYHIKMTQKHQECVLITAIHKLYSISCYCRDICMKCRMYNREKYAYVYHMQTCVTILFPFLVYKQSDCRRLSYSTYINVFTPYFIIIVVLQTWASLLSCRNPQGRKLLHCSSIQARNNVK